MYTYKSHLPYLLERQPWSASTELSAVFTYLSLYMYMYMYMYISICMHVCIYIYI